MNCIYCGKQTNRPKFCCNKHKDKYHNKHNPRGIYAHFKNDNDKLDWKDIDDNHSFEEKTREIWKDIPRFGGLIQASTLGRIRRIHKDGFYYLLSSPIRGYQRILISINGIRKLYGIHTLVAETFLQKPKNKTQINHKNFNRSDNRIGNLEWCSARENIQHALRNGRYPSRKGSAHPRAKLSDKQVEEIRNWFELHKWKLGDYKKLSKKYKLTGGTISRIVRRKIWKHF